ncbi:MAG: ABC transporter permease [Mycoplasmataceae bacterium]|nr:ABC transporter permease [Mycoplasmataceae bacterium]
MNKQGKFTRSKFLSFIKHWYIFIVLAIIYVPLIFIVLLSFNEPTARGNININFGTPTMINYLNLWQDDEFLNGLFNSLLLSVIVVPISLLLAIVTCFGMWRAKPYQKKAVNFTTQLTIVNPEAITGISLALLFSSTWVAMGFNLGFFTVVLAHISFCTPYAIVAIYPRMAKMNQNQLLASYDLGHTKMNTFWKITIPYLMPALLAAVAIVLSMSLDDFIITNLVNGSFQTIGTLIYSTRKGIKAWVVTFGALVVIITIVIIVVLGIRKYFKLKKENKKSAMVSESKGES